MESRQQSHYKITVLQREEAYRKAIQGRIFSTDPKRLASLEKIRQSAGEHDFIFLLSVIMEAVNIPDSDSVFRDDIGKEAYKQLINYCASALETSLVMLSAGAAVCNHPTYAVYLGLLVFACNQVEHVLQQALTKSPTLPRGIDQGIQRVAFDETPLYKWIPQKLKQLSIASFTYAGQNILNNMSRFAYSNLLFFSQSKTEKTAPSASSQPIRPSR